MRIYYVANVRMPTDKAHGIQLAKMSEALIEAGAVVTLVVPHRGQGDAQSFYKLRRPIPVIRIPTLNLGNSRLGFNLSALSFAAFSFLFLFFHRLEKDAVIYTIDLDQFSFFLLPLLSRPLFVEVHGTKKKSIFADFFFKRIYGVIAVSEGVKQSLIKIFNLLPGRIIVCPNSIDLEMYKDLPNQLEARQILGIPPTSTIFLYVGRFYGWKGLAVLPEATVSVKNKAFVYLVGGGRDDFLRVVSNQFIPPNMVFVGVKPFSEIPIWLTAADFLLITGTKKDEYSFHETSPMKLFEYLAVGRPIISADTPALRTIVSETEVLFYEPDNAVDLARTMNLVLNNATDFREKTEKILVKAKKYSWRRRAETILNFIHNFRS